MRPGGLRGGALARCRSISPSSTPLERRRPRRRIPAVGRWVIAGHSLGGAAAADFVARNAKADGAVPVAGLLLLASYPGRGADLSTKSSPGRYCRCFTRCRWPLPTKIAAARGSPALGEPLRRDRGRQSCAVRRVRPPAGRRPRRDTGAGPAKGDRRRGDQPSSIRVEAGAGK